MKIPNINKLTTSKKLVLLEKLWENLSCNPEKLASPAWHEKELNRTSGRVARGEEKILDWTSAKKRLRAV